MAGSPEILGKDFGRGAFGSDPANYHAVRPPYPEAVWSALRERAGLRVGIDILEIGAGTGLATGPLLAHEPSRLVAVEPDPRLAVFLRSEQRDPRLEVIEATFEDAALPADAFDLVASGTAFHWLDAVPALTRIRGLLRPGGAVALFWNGYGDSDRVDLFHEATVHLFAGSRPSPASGTGKVPHAEGAAGRLKDFRDAGYAADEPQFVRQELFYDPPGVRALYATYSNVTALPLDMRERLLDGLMRVAEVEFGGRVMRSLITAIYTARPL